MSTKVRNCGGKKSGQYVWKIYGKNPNDKKDITVSPTTNGYTIPFQLASTTVDLSMVDESFFVGYSIHAVHGTWYGDFNLSTTSTGTWTQDGSEPKEFTWSYDPSTKKITVTSSTVNLIQATSYTWSLKDQNPATFIDFIVSDSPTAYPDGGEHGGYWYERFDNAVKGIDFGEVTLASEARSITVKHSLGVVPTKVYLIPTPAKIPSQSKTIIVIDDKVLFGRGLAGLSFESCGQTKNTDSVTFNCYQSSSYDNEAFEALTYKWFAIV